jgi:hypothetical protein
VGSADRGDAIGAEARALHGRANGIPYQVTFATGIPSFSNIGGFGRWREGINPRYALGDDISWAKGSTLSRADSKFAERNPTDSMIRITTPLSHWAAAETTQLCSRRRRPKADYRINNQRSDGSEEPAVRPCRLGDEHQSSFRCGQRNRNHVGGYSDHSQQSPLVEYTGRNERVYQGRWKVRDNLTLNVGVHWEWYGMPYEKNGLAARVVGDESSFTNVACTSTIGVAYSSNCTNLATVQFVGKNSTHPELGPTPTETTITTLHRPLVLHGTFRSSAKGGYRSGYGINYEGALRNFITVDGDHWDSSRYQLSVRRYRLNLQPNRLHHSNSLSLPIPFPPEHRPHRHFR